jgi:murein DD-endopeptidase MepM/ murein hydrolase activator NlpD
VRTDLRIAERRKAALSRRIRASQRAARARQGNLNALRRAKRGAVYRREVAEGALGGLIERMTRLAAARVAQQSAVRPAGSSNVFSWPSKGRITQSYGCTGFHLNPRKGSCRHFHDGLDIVDSYGTSIRTAAVGVVAYVGWNPWDEGGRAWIVVVAHPDGFVTRYGHLVPSRRVQAGSLVHTGQVIGKMGSTGRSTGTHLHFELLRGGSTVNPTTYLPSGVVKIKVDKKSTKKGVAKARKKARAKARAADRRQAAKMRKRARQAQGSKPAADVLITTCEADPSRDAAGTGMLYAVALVSAVDQTAVDGDECTTESASAPPLTTTTTTTSSAAGIRQSAARNESQLARAIGATAVRLPSRGTSPLPS